MLPCDQVTWSNPTTNTLAVDQHRITASVSFVASKCHAACRLLYHTTPQIYCKRCHGIVKELEKPSARKTQREQPFFCWYHCHYYHLLLSLLPSLPSPLLWSTKRNPLSDWLWNKWDKSFDYESCYSLLIIIGRCYYIQWPDCTVNLFSSLSFVYLFFDLFI